VTTPQNGNINTDGMGSQEVERNAPGEGMGGRTLTTEKKRNA